MAMSNYGLTKLIEECGELIQVAAKKIAYPDSVFHPDDKVLSIRHRIQDEIADVLAAVKFVTEKFDLNLNDIEKRMLDKLYLYRKWDKE